MSRKTNISKKPEVRDYGIQSYRAGDDKDYSEIIGTPTFFAANAATVVRESEFAKPYKLDDGDDYSSMEYPWPHWPRFDYPGIDFPGMDLPMLDFPDLPIIHGGFSGCGFDFPGLFSENIRGEIKYVYLSDFYTHSDTPFGDPIPDDPIVGWSITSNATILSAGLLSACIKINDDAEYGSIVRITATTRSGATCNSMGWIKEETCTGASWDTVTSAETVAASSSCTVAITDGGSGEKTWSVGGTGFWLDAGFTITSLDTSANSITLYTDASACGSATIAACGATGYVRCTTGTWVYKPAYDDQCLSSGGGSYIGSAIYRKIYGNKRLDQAMGYAACTSYPKKCYQSPTCPGTTGCGAWTSDVCLPWDCTFIYGATGVQCNEGCCNHTCVSSAWAYCPYIASIKNYEWEC